MFAGAMLSASPAPSSRRDLKFWTVGSFQLHTSSSRLTRQCHRRYSAVYVSWRSSRAFWICPGLHGQLSRNHSSGWVLNGSFLSNASLKNPSLLVGSSAWLTYGMPPVMPIPSWSESLASLTSCGPAACHTDPGENAIAFRSHFSGRRARRNDRLPPRLPPMTAATRDSTRRVCPSGELNDDTNATTKFSRNGRSEMVNGPPPGPQPGATACGFHGPTSV